MEGTTYPPYLLFNKLSIMLRYSVAIICTLFLVLTFRVNAQADVWYNSAQSRIDTLRKGDFVLKISDISGNPISDNVKINLKKHDLTLHLHLQQNHPKQKLNFLLQKIMFQ